MDTRSFSGIKIAGLACFVVLVVVGIALGNQRMSELVAASTADAARQPQPTKPPEPELTVVVAVGDSTMNGSDMNSGPVWIEQLGEAGDWKLFNASVGGSGYTIKGHSENMLDIAERFAARYAVDMYLFGGGLNDAIQDVPPSKIERSVTRTFERLREATPGADIVVVSPFPTPLIPSNAEPEAAIGEVLKRVTEKFDGHYIDLEPLPVDMIGEDTIHANDAGHTETARVVAEALARWGIPREDAYQPR